MNEPVTPHDLEAEKAVLGAILVDGALFLDVAEELAPRDFFREAHAKVFQVMRNLASAGEPIDALTVRATLQQRNELDEIGGPAYLFGLTDGVPMRTNIGAYARIVKDRAATSRLISAARRILIDAQSGEKEARELIDAAERAIFAVAEQSTHGDFIDAETMVREGMPSLEQMIERRGTTGIATGFIDFDDMTRGFQPGALVLIAARPSMGKSAFALNVAYHAASHGHAVGFFSLEMSREELFIRLVSSVGKLDGHRLQSGYASPADFTRMTAAFAEIGQSGLHVDDSSSVGVLEMRGKARRLKARRGLDLVLVDYLQLMQLEHSENRNLAVADASRALKLLARELQIPVVALSQLSRETERRAEKRPMLSDLRDSGALEQDADLVVFIHRPEVYQSTHDNDGVAEIIIAKQRNGPTGTVQLRWEKETTRFVNSTGRVQ